MSELGPSAPTRWEAEMAGPAWDSYRRRFRTLFADGADLDGEARLIDAMLPRAADVLDAGCGTGRVADALRRRGHSAVGVDRDAGLLAAARDWYGETTYIDCDLLDLDTAVLQDAGAPTAFDVVALPGNVMVFVAPGTERAVLKRLSGLLKPNGRIVAGFATDRAYTVTRFDEDALAIGLDIEQRFATWDLAPWTADAGWVVTVLRAP